MTVSSRSILNVLRDTRRSEF